MSFLHFGPLRWGTLPLWARGPYINAVAYSPKTRQATLSKKMERTYGNGETPRPTADRTLTGPVTSIIAREASRPMGPPTLPEPGRIPMAPNKTPMAGKTPTALGKAPMAPSVAPVVSRPIPMPSRAGAARRLIPMPLSRVPRAPREARVGAGTLTATRPPIRWVAAAPTPRPRRRLPTVRLA